MKRCVTVGEVNPNATAPSDAGFKTRLTRVDRLFLRMAGRQPASPAIVQGDRMWTYGDLSNRALRVSKQLQQRLTGCQTVAIHGPMSGALVGAMLGVMHAGHVFVLIDPALPEVRRAKMLQKTAPALVLTTDESGLADAALPVLSVSESWVEAADDTMPNAHYDHPNDRAYVFFTSGSTGEPKAILGSHDGLAHFVGWQGERFGVGPGDRVANLTALSFDVVLREMFLPLTTGASLHIPSVPTTDAAALVNWLGEEKITIFHAVPSLLQYWVRRCEAMFLKDLRLVFSAGEPLVPRLVRDLSEAFGPQCSVINLYGPTETTLAKFYMPVGTDSETRNGLIPVGRPLPHSWASLKIDGQHLVAASAPVDTIGEVFIHTRYPTYGYLGNTKATAAAFEGPDPSGVVRYDTGDLGFFDAKENLVIVGRKDDQVKINGVRIEPNEIAECILSSGYVDVTHVAPLKLAGGTYQLNAYVVWRDAQQSNLEALLRTHLAERLPPPMIPAGLVVLDKLPHLPNGKIDRKALPAPQLQGVFRPDSLIEARLAESWKSVLGLSELPGKTDFFALGGDSLLSQELCLLCEEEFGVELTINDLFTQRDIPGVAALLAKGGRAPIPPAPAQETYPLSAAQRRYYVMNRPRENLSWNRLDLRVETSSGKGLEAVKRAVRTLFERNEALRAEIVDAPGGGPRQVFRNVADLPDWTVSSSTGTSATLRVHSFDAAGDVGHIDIEWSAEEKAKGVLRLKIPHLLVDGFSAELLINEITQLLCGTEMPRQHSLAYRDFAVWSVNQSTPANSLEARDFWTSVLPRSFKGLRLRPRHKNPQTPFAGSTCKLVLGRDEMDQANRHYKETGASVFAFYCAAFARVLHTVCKRERLALITPLTCRDHPEISKLIGCVYSHVPIVSHFNADTGVAAHADAIDRTLGQAITYQNYYIDQLLDLYGVRPDTPEWPISSFAFNFMTVNGRKPETKVYHQHERLDSRFDAQLYVRRYLDGVTADIQYREAVLSFDEVDALLVAWRNQLVDPEGSARQPIPDTLRKRVILEGWVNASTKHQATSGAADHIGKLHD